MRSVINEKPATVRPEYPKLMRTKDHAAVVLFSSRYCGVVVSAGGPHFLGDWSSTWVSTYFEPFFGSVTLIEELA